MFRRTYLRSALPAGAALLAAGVLAAGCSSNSASSGGSGSNASVTIKAVLPPNTGPITAADNAGLLQLTQQYQAAHKNVTVQWLPNNMSSITQSNAQLESQASGGSAPDVVLGAVRPGDLRCPPGRAAAEHQALPGQAQPLRARQLQLAVNVHAFDHPLHDLAQR